MTTRVAAVDLGATSVRVCTCDVERSPLDYDVVHRVAHEPQRSADGVLRWEWDRILAAVTDGLGKAAEHGPLASIGVDTWAVDYGLLDASEELVGNPACYRDNRTCDYRSVVDRAGAERLYALNGLPCVPFNTIFQVDAEDPDLLARARHLLTLPELVVHHLTGEITSETTSAGSTGLAEQATRNWSPELCDLVDLDPRLLPEIRASGAPVGRWKGVPVHLVAGHDTASAVIGTALTGPDAGFVSSGTWILAGRELSEPVLTDDARQAGFANEYGPESTTRFLKNVAGFWILEECRRSWGDLSLAELYSGVSLDSTADLTFDATHERFLAPDDMLREVLEATGLTADTERQRIVAVILDSLARTTADVLATSSALSGCTLGAVHLVGGGVRAPGFLERLQRYVEGSVTAGAAESAALGNAIVQGIALGRWTDVAAARKDLLP